MPDISDEELRLRFLEKRGFSLEPPMDSMARESHPPHRRSELEAVGRLKKKSLIEYIKSIKTDAGAPWKQARLWRVEYIRDLARERKECDDTEYSWRATLEQEVLRPFRVQSAW